MRSATVAFSVILRDDRENFILFPMVLSAVNMGFCRALTFLKTYCKSILCTVCYYLTPAPGRKKSPKRLESGLASPHFGMSARNNKNYPRRYTGGERQKNVHVILTPTVILIREFLQQQFTRF